MSDEPLTVERIRRWQTELQHIGSIVGMDQLIHVHMHDRAREDPMFAVLNDLYYWLDGQAKALEAEG